MSVRSFFSLGKRTNERSILTTDCPQSIVLVCSGNHTYQDDYIYILYH